MLEEENIQTILKDDAINTIKKKNNSDDVLITNKDIDIHKKYVILDEGVETAQCLTYADVIPNDNMLGILRKRNMADTIMLMTMIVNDSHYTLSFPILQLDEEENPDKLISKWLKDNHLDDVVKELTIRPVNIVGNEHDILVFSAFINK